MSADRDRSLHHFLAGALILLFAALNLSIAMSAHTPLPPKTLHEGVLVYRTKVHPAQIDPGLEWKDRFSIPLTVKFAQFNIPETLTVHFSRGRSKVEKTDTDHGWKGWSAVFRNPDEEDCYCKELQFLKFCVPFRHADMVMTHEESELPEITLTDEYEDILGYRCRKALHDMGGVRSEVWFSEELEIRGDPEGILEKEGIPGTVFKVREVPGKWQVFYSETVLTELREEHQPEEVFTPPGDCRHLENHEDALQANRDLLFKALQSKKGSSRDLAGLWKLMSPEDDIFMQISPGEEEWALRTYYLKEGREISQKGRPAGNWLLVMRGDRYDLYELGGSGRLSMLNFAPFIWERSSLEALEAARKQY